MSRALPRIGSWGGNPAWTKKPRMAPFCTAPGCKCRAVRQPWIEASWFRGEDVRSGPLCKEHSERPASELLEWAAAWAAENKRKQEAGDRRSRERKAQSARDIAANEEKRSTAQ